MNKNQFMYLLQQQLDSLDSAAVTEILADFEEHFANGLARGKSEDEIAVELGNPAEIAQQYLDAGADGLPSAAVMPMVKEPLPAGTSRAAAVNGTPSPAASAAAAGQSANANPAAAGRAPAAGTGAPMAAVKTQAKPINEGALVAVILLNILLGIPIWISLFATLFSFWVAAGSIGVVACVLFAVAILQTGITSLILVLFGVSMTALTILAVLFMVYLTKWLIAGLNAYIRWNRKLVRGGAAA